MKEFDLLSEANAFVTSEHIQATWQASLVVPSNKSRFVFAEIHKKLHPLPRDVPDALGRYLL